jgi:transcriptional antiterminator Rof (Rho-off)
MDQRRVECINNNWHTDIETGQSGLSFKHGKIYETVEATSGIESDKDIIVVNEQGKRHIIKTESGLTSFFNRHFRFVQL